MPFSGSAADRIPETILIRQQASDEERLAALEVQRYVYLRMGKLLPVKRGFDESNRIVVSRKDRSFCEGVGLDLASQQFILKTDQSKTGQVWWIVGGDEIGTLYGAYRFAERLGVRFGIDEDIVPHGYLRGGLPAVHEIGKPRFAVRGLQPFHDFSVGPDWWNLHDYENVLSQMVKLRLNFLGLHTYPSWNPSAGPEANVWIGLPEDVDAQGNVRFGYESGVVTTRRGWEVSPYPTSRYAAGAGLFFESDDYGPDFLLKWLDWPKSGDQAAAMFNEYGEFQKSAFTYAHRLGIKTCVGLEVPLGIPKALSARIQAKGMNEEDPAVIARLYEGTFLRLKRKIPIDYFWLWAPEIWLGSQPGCTGWEITTRSNVQRDLGIISGAAQAAQAPFRFATCGWRLGTIDDPFWFHQRTPANWVASSINTSVGADPVEKHYGAMPTRPKWAIGWAEDDNTAGAHCCTCWDLQLWVERMLTNSIEAYRYGCEGMMAIHWRTAAVSPNIMALARAGWDFFERGSNDVDSKGDSILPGADEFWLDWGRGNFGDEAGPEIGSIMQKFDASHPAMNALIAQGSKTTDARISEFFDPLREMEILRSRVRGAENLQRFDYWTGIIHATEMRVRSWVLADRLTGLVKAAEEIKDMNKQRTFVRSEVVPMRLALTRSFQTLIATLVKCARSPGEIGTISSIESGMRERLLSRNDQAIRKILREPLPQETLLDSSYRGSPRIFLSSRYSQMKTSEPQEIRACVLSESKCKALSLYWRALGESSFQKVAGVHQARQAYRATLPAHSEGTLEYFLEATLADGQTLCWPPTAPEVCQTVVVW